MLQPIDITKDRLQAIYEKAGFHVERDSDGDVVVKDLFHMFVEPIADGKHIRMYALFGTKDSASMESKLALATRVNDGYVCPRAGVTERGRFVVEHYVNADGGLTEENLVASTRFFSRSLLALAAADTADVLS
jgi:hypothetical protein